MGIRAQSRLHRQLNNSERTTFSPQQDFNTRVARENARKLRTLEAVTTREKRNARLFENPPRRPSSCRDRSSTTDYNAREGLKIVTFNEPFNLSGGIEFYFGLELWSRDGGSAKGNKFSYRISILGRTSIIYSHYYFYHSSSSRTTLICIIIHSNGVSSSTKNEETSIYLHHYLSISFQGSAPLRSKKKKISFIVDGKEREREQRSRFFTIKSSYDWLEGSHNAWAWHPSARGARHEGERGGGREKEGFLCPMVERLAV